MKKNKQQPTLFKDILSLGKITIALPVAFSAFTGYMVYAKAFEWAGLAATLGIFFLAMASSAMNQWQERKLDRMMPRTNKRPIAAGRVSPLIVGLTITGFALLGSILLFLGGNLIALIVGWLSFIWYNAIYTPLKRKSAFAVVPGSIVGALPPVAGYTAAGGHYSDPAALLLAFFFFMGQIPHFWLLLLNLGEQYEKAGFPTLNQLFPQSQLKKLTFVWIVASVVTALLLPVYKMLVNPFVIGVLVAAAAITIAAFFNLLTTGDQKLDAKKSFMRINMFFLLVMVSLITDALLQ